MIIISFIKFPNKIYQKNKGSFDWKDKLKEGRLFKGGQSKGFFKEDQYL